MLSLIFYDKEDEEFIWLLVEEADDKKVLKVFSSSSFERQKVFEAFTGFERDPLPLDRIDEEKKMIPIPIPYKFFKYRDIIPILTSFEERVKANNLPWKPPDFFEEKDDEEESLELEWYFHSHQLHLIFYLDKPPSYIKVWGTSIEDEMEVGTLTSSLLLPLYQWCLTG